MFTVAHGQAPRVPPNALTSAPTDRAMTLLALTVMVVLPNSANERAWVPAPVPIAVTFRSVAVCVPLVALLSPMATAFAPATRQTVSRIVPPFWTQAMVLEKVELDLMIES